MASCKKNFESSNDVIPRSTEILSFPFHYLPVLVQWKILKQYIPILCKAFVLQEMPEFSKLLEYHQSWTKPSKIFFEFFSILCSLKKGIYLNLENVSKKAYYISMDQRKITFTLCGLDLNLIKYKMFTVTPDSPRNPFTSKLNIPITLSILEKFLTTFLKNYTLSIDNVVKFYEFRGDLFINYSMNKVCWNNGNFYDIIDGSCVVKLNKFIGYQIILKDNYLIEVRHNPLNPFSFDIGDFSTCETEILTPISLETYLLSKGKQVYTTRIICDIHFQFMADDHVMLNVKADNPWLCLKYLDANLLDCLECIKDVFNKYNIVSYK